MQNNTISTLFIARNLIRLPAVDSTNNYLKQLVSKSEPLAEGTVIMADNQFAGRGQQENIWHAEPGLNLTFSIFLKPVFLPIAQQFLLNMAVCMGINDALVEYIKNGIKVKWPNDIYCHHEKMGGVLIENSISGNVIKSSIIGIGINVNQQNLDPEKTGNATSLNKILQRDVNLSELLSALCNHIEAHYLKLRAGKHNELHKAYLHSLYQYEEPAKYKTKGEIFEATIIDVTQAGQLVLVDGNSEKRFNFKEVEFLVQPDKKNQSL